MRFVRTIFKQVGRLLRIISKSSPLVLNTALITKLILTTNRSSPSVPDTPALLESLSALARSLETTKAETYSSVFLEAFVEPLLDLLELAPLFQTASGSNSAQQYTARFFHSLELAILHLLRHLPEEKNRKQFVLQLLHKTRCPSAAVRLTVVRIIKSLWKRQTGLVLPTVSDVLLFAVELLEDEDEEIEKVTKQIMKLVQDATGEDVREMMK